MKTKSTNKVWLCALAAVALLASACEETNEVQSPEFPTEVANHTVAAGDAVTIDFTANTDWQLSSDAIWCKVDGMFLDTSGKAGKQQVTFQVSADGQSVDESKANITLRMGDESKIIAVITRTGITGAVVLVGDDTCYEHNQSMNIGTSGTLALTIRELSFDINSLYIENNTEWLDIDRADTIITLSVKTEFLRFSINNETDSICFSNKDVPMMRLHVSYAGVDARSIVLEPATQWALKVAVDGKTYTDGLYTTTGVVHDAPIRSSVTVLNNEYELVHIAFDKANGYTVADSLWYTVEDDQKGNIAISFTENTGADRMGYLFVLPQAICDSVRANDGAYLDFFIAEGIIKTEVEKYLLAEFTQEGPLSNTMRVIYGPTWEYMDVVPETEQQWLEIAMGYMVSEENVFRTSLEFGAPYILNPMLSLDAWDPSTLERPAEIQVYGAYGEEYVRDRDYRFDEPTMMEEEGEHYLLQGFQFYIEEPFIIYFVDSNKIPLKALVVTPIL